MVVFFLVSLAAIGGRESVRRQDPGRNMFRTPRRKMDLYPLPFPSDEHANLFWDNDAQDAQSCHASVPVLPDANERPRQLLVRKPGPVLISKLEWVVSLSQALPRF